MISWNEWKWKHNIWRPFGYNKSILTSMSVPTSDYSKKKSHINDLMTSLREDLEKQEKKIPNSPQIKTKKDQGKNK